MNSRKGPSVLDIAFAGFALALIPLAVIACFTVEWWLAFVPLGFVIALIIVLIFLRLRRLFKDVQAKGLL
jgi:hypothetical protein